MLAFSDNDYTPRERQTSHYFRLWCIPLEQAASRCDRLRATQAPLQEEKVKVSTVQIVAGLRPIHGPKPILPYTIYM